MKTVGIIGGLGPETTAEFYLKLVFSCYEKQKDCRPPILLWSIPMDYQIENDLITKGVGEERCLLYLIDAAKKLEAGGADFLVIPCNSVHVFINEVRQTVKIPVLSIVEETSKFLVDKQITEVGLLATATTVNNNLYQNALQNKGIKVVLPNPEEQAAVGKLISNLVLNQKTEEDKKQLLAIIQSLKDRGCKNIVLACTDLQLLVPPNHELCVYDTMEILVNSTVREILG